MTPYLLISASISLFYPVILLPTRFAVWRFIRYYFL